MLEGFPLKVEVESVHWEDQNLGFNLLGQFMHSQSKTLKLKGLSTNFAYSSLQIQCSRDSVGTKNKLNVQPYSTTATRGRAVTWNQKTGVRSYRSPRHRMWFNVDAREIVIAIIWSRETWSSNICYNSFYNVIKSTSYLCENKNRTPYYVL